MYTYKDYVANFAYLRVSTTDQTTAQQLSQITGAGFKVARDRVFIEHAVSGAVPALQREQFKRLHDRMNSGDSLIVVRLDRLGRSVLDIISTVESLTARGISIVVLGLGTLDQSAQSKLTLNVLAAISQFEKQIISERTKAKLSQLKKDGVKLGRPVKHSDETLKAKAVELFNNGKSWRKVAAELGVALSTLQRMMRPD